jgi:hypothetical protein
MKAHCKKRLAIFPSRESLVSDIPAGDRKINNLYLQRREQEAGIKLLLS